MIASIKKTPATSAGVSPSERAKALRRIGTSVSQKMDKLREGNVLMMPSGAYVILRRRYDMGRSGHRVLLRELEGAALRSINYDAHAWVAVLQLPPTVDMRLGEIVLYPGDSPEHSVAAIRHHHGWMRTSAPWTPFSDVEVCLHLQENRAHYIRKDFSEGKRRSRYLPLGTVVATQDMAASEPTVWVRTGENLWAGNNRGVTASDLMINYELDRRTYRVVWVPETN